MINLSLLLKPFILLVGIFGYVLSPLNQPVPHHIDDVPPLDFTGTTTIEDIPSVPMNPDTGRKDPVTPSRSGAFITDSCIGDICIDRTQAFTTEKDGTLVQIIVGMYQENGDIKREYVTKARENTELIETIRVNPKTFVASKKVDEMMSLKTMDYQKVGNVIVRTDTSGGCGSAETRQQILDLNGKIVDFDSQIAYPKTFSLGNITYTLSGVNFEFTDSAILLSPIQAFPDILSVQDSLGKKILEHSNTEKFLSPGYVIRFKELPGIQFLYTAGFEPSYRTAFLGNDAKWLQKNIDKNGKLMDLEVTKKILGGIRQNNGKSVVPNEYKNTGGSEAMDKELKENNLTLSDLPVFRVISIDNAGNYLVYPSEKYAIVMLAELCKPLVYVYSSLPGSQSLTVNLPAGGFFTKLIPEFSNGNSWRFIATESGSLHMGEDTYDSLYYSAKVPNYQFQKNGWQVRGKDIIAFFRDKLPKTGMNDREMNDFIDFWEDQFVSESVYFISFKFDHAIDPYAELVFDQKPYSMHRILLEAYPLTSSLIHPEFMWPEVGDRADNMLLRSFYRSGVFDVVEWGGVLLDRERNTFIIK